MDHAHDRRRVLHFSVTEHPTAAWTAQQIIEAFPEASAPKYVMRDRDRIYGATFRDRLMGMGIEEVLSAPRSPWQNPFVERLIGSDGASASTTFISLIGVLVAALLAYLGGRSKPIQGPHRWCAPRTAHCRRLR